MNYENLYHPGPTIRTYTGHYLNVLEPDPAMINIVDIAHALSMNVRFGGHLPAFYCVAQHSIIVSNWVKPEHRLAALLHDASEAYLIDLPRPIKQQLPDYKVIEDNLMRVISGVFGFEYPFHESIKEADDTVLEIEWNCLMLGKNWSILPMYQIQAEKEFIKAFRTIVN